MTLLAVSSALFAPNAKSQGNLDSGSVIFNGTLENPGQDTCSFSGEDDGKLGFDVTNNIIKSIDPAQITATITKSTTSQLSDFVIELRNPTIARKASENGSFEEFDVLDKGIGASANTAAAPEPTLGQSTLRVTPPADQTNLKVMAVFEKQGGIEEGDYRSTVSLACYVSF